LGRARPLDPCVLKTCYPFGGSGGGVRLTLERLPDVRKVA
jgi:hypothetical protein